MEAIQTRERILRARQSLHGLSCGDAFGERFFLPDETALALAEARALPAPPWFFTDDSLMAMSIVSVLAESGAIDQRKLARSFAANYDPARGYGPAMHRLLTRLRSPAAQWKEEAAALFGGQGSFGNGSAMRVAPLGAYFADDLKLAVAQAEMSSMVTHSHPEAIAGAVAVAAAAALAWQRSVQGRDFLAAIDEITPSGALRRGLQRAIDLPPETPLDTATDVLGNGSAITAPDTVPFCLWVAAYHLDNYEEALWTTVRAMGDRDTTCAIVGGIVVMSSGLESIPAEWLESREALPGWVEAG
ncbi:MAG: ADP-ribosylglycohydrolase family protein [Acidobacteriia bacterium]|nr:ADP-ribosylglycohydrolase family protein [Terriglobia bacterium]